MTDEDSTTELESLRAENGRMRLAHKQLQEALSTISHERDHYRAKSREIESDLIYYRGLVTNAPEKEKSLEQQIAFAFQAHAVDEFGAIMWLARVIDRISNISKGETK
jgi:hypothetical protein